ncbi:MAG: glycosylasparaginase, partial [Ferruginibacter sp.]
KKAVERIVKRDREKAKTLQVGFLALNKKGQYGAYAIQNGFVFSVKSEKENVVHQSKFLI